MKALVYEGPKSAVVKDVAEPVKREGTVKVDVTYCGICGSDIGIYLGTHPRAKAPLILGHEFIGTVAEDGQKFKKGDRVAPFPLLSCGTCRACRTGSSHVCNALGLLGIDTDGGICETTYVDEDVLFKVPDGLSDKAASVIEPLAVIVRAVHQAGFRALDMAVVIGAGPIGMLTGIVLKHIGASQVFISDIADERLKMAEEFGMTAVNSSRENLGEKVRAATDGEGCDVLFECSGAAPSAMEMTDITQVSGTICMTAIHKVPHEVNLRDFNFKEQKLIGSRVYTKEEFAQAVVLAKELEDQLEKVVSHVVPLSDSAKVFDMIADPSYGTVKVVVDCTKK